MWFFNLIGLIEMSVAITWGNSLTIRAKSGNCINLVPLECPSGRPRGSRNILSGSAELRKD